MQGNITYMPNNATLNVGEEILVVNNDTNFQSMTNGMSPDDPLAGKLFDTGPIPAERVCRIRSIESKSGKLHLLFN